MKNKNRIIAEFMGVEFNTEKDKCDHPLIKAPWPPIECLKYHSSWDWLMPVIIKISQIDSGDSEECAYPRTFGMFSQTGQVMVRLNGFALFRADTLIEAAYLAVVDFIEHFKESNT